MGLTNFLSGLFGKSSQTINISTYREENNSRVLLQSFSVFTVVETISALASNCEFKTYEAGKENKGKLWYSLNVKPNKNQTSTEFWREFFSKLLYYGEVLVVQTTNNDFIIADSFQKNDFAISESTFTDVIRGDFTFNRSFSMRDVIYLKNNNTSIEIVLKGIFELYESMISGASDKYTQDGGEKGILNVSTKAQGDKDFEAKFKMLMSDYFKSYFNNKNAVLPLFEGYEYKSTSDKTKQYTNEVTDVKTLFNEGIVRAAQAYHFSPALITGEIAGIKEALNLSLTCCIDPLINMVSEELTAKLYTADEAIKGNIIEGDTNCIKHVDIFDIAQSADKLISCGAYTPNEIRVKSGDKLVLDDAMNKHYITKNYAENLSLEGGE